MRMAVFCTIARVLMICWLLFLGVAAVPELAVTRYNVGHVW
jgi:hypothetical protein